MRKVKLIVHETYRGTVFLSNAPEIKFDSSDCQIAAINPFRYRGYYYEAETGFYYVSSRYYDPEIGRFLNADEAAYLGA